MTPLCAALFFLKEAFDVRRLYYPNSSFASCDRALLKGANPYRVCRKFLESQGATHVHLYGETPLTTWAKIAQEAEICPEDFFVDLGCGRGRGVFFMAHQTGCRAHGIDSILEFVEKGNAIAEKFPRVTFSCEDLFFAQLHSATVIYLYGTCLTDEEVERLSALLGRLKKGTRIISISEPLPGNFSLKKEFSVTFPWGRTSAYLQIVASYLP